MNKQRSCQTINSSEEKLVPECLSGNTIEYRTRDMPANDTLQTFFHHVPANETIFAMPTNETYLYLQFRLKSNMRINLAPPALCGCAFP
jgi:hypothetical protein